MINQIGQVSEIKPIQNKNRSIWVLLPIAFYVTVGSILAALIFSILGFQIFYLDRAYPGLSVAGVDVSGMTLAEIEQVITTQAEAHTNEPLSIQVADKTYTFTKRELGLQVDVPATASQAFYTGRQGDLLTDMRTHLSLLFHEKDVEPIILYDTSPSHQILQSLIDVSNYPPKDAEIIIHSPNHIELVPAVYGQKLHLEATRPLVEEAVFSSSSEPVQAVVQKVRPALTDEDVLPAYTQVQRLLSSPLSFTYRVGDEVGKWHIEPKTLLSMVSLDRFVDEAGKLQVAVRLNKEALRPYFAEMAKAINQEAVDGKIAWDGEEEKAVVKQESKDGRKLDLEAAYAVTVEAVQSGSNSIKLPVEVQPAAVSTKNVANMGITTLITQATSYFQGSSAGRMKNIEVAASKFDGVVIPPGEIFSFNKYLGPVTKEEGYDESLVIFGNRTAVGIGGGVCQVSTTVFRAALLAGFEIVERWAHGYRVSWYEINSEIGLDATIYAPNVDFRFKNDTDHYLLIHTESNLDAGTVTFKFYGAPIQREVEISKPVITNVVKHGPPIYEPDPSLPEGVTKQVDWANNGMDVSVTRVVKEGDQILYKDEIVSRYQPWTAVYKVGAKRTQPQPLQPTAPNAPGGTNPGLKPLPSQAVPYGSPDVAPAPGTVIGNSGYAPYNPPPVQ
ncbi:MAG TPA: VanW family protein [Anaerolineae bacterium]|nr:VanW family protein [Anaerolineae bacterium]HMR64876.1 VanW family protein [Anaerolineae bacterium]